MALLLAGFIIGWLMAGQANQTTVSGGDELEEITELRAQDLPPAVNPHIPSEDVPGADILGLPRFPESVRIEYKREDLGEVIATEVEYLTPQRLEDVQEFYRNVFRAESWYMGDIGFSRGAWTFFVIKDEREAFVELKPRGGGIVEIDMELTETQSGDVTAEPVDTAGFQNPSAPASGSARQIPAPSPVHDGADDSDNYKEEDSD